MRKKIWHSILAVAMGSVTAIGCMAMTASGCDPQDEPHVHTFSEGWKNDDPSGHWHEANCGHDVKGDFAEHVYDDETDATCNICGYTRIIQSEEPDPDPTDPDSNPNPSDPEEQTFEGKIYVVGDSTVCSFDDKYYLPRYGYGTQLYNYFNLESENQIVNLALSGRSSLSYLKETEYKTLTSSITEGDYLIIGFGHNDEKSDDTARYTNPNKSYTDSSTTDGPSFQYTLYQNYVKLAKDNGATPILCTPIVRYSSTANYDGTNGHVTSIGNYPDAIRTLGSATGTTVIDLTAITKADYTALGTDAAYYHAHTTYKGTIPNETPDGIDTTHINYFGAKMVAYEFATALGQTDCTLKNYVKTNITKPTKDADFANGINADYVKPDYSGFDPSEHTANKLTDDGWYKTVMGNTGGNDKFDKYTVSESNGTFTVGNTGGNGKIESGSDGFAAAFKQIDITKNFRASATVKVTAKESSANNQAAFGMMLRDDIYVDETVSNLASNYVAAAALGDGSAAIFSRASTSLAKTKNTVTVEEGSTFEVSIERLGQVVTVKFGSFTETFTDFDFVAVDNNYMYLCLMANRGITVEFTNVNFEITGDAQGA